MSPRLVALLVVLTVGSSELSAQQVRLRPQASLDLPTRISIQDGVLHVRQKIGVTIGAQLILTFNPCFDVVTGVSYMPGYAMLHGAGKVFEAGIGSHLLTGTTGARYWLLPRVRKLSWEIHTGFGLVFGGRRAYQDLFETSTVSGVIGTTVRYQIARFVSLKLRIHERLYRLRFGGLDPGRSRSPLQVSFGLGLPFVESAP